ncbi:MAG: hypothetical protein IJP01_03615 [Oscillospiraceae bacterium]|nr:hypothetical protein [Oscillospiraceae bacterium]
MPGRLNGLGGGPSHYTLDMDYLRGVDFTSAPINVENGRAFDAPNMIRDVPGKVRKRMGYEVFRSYGERINGIFRFENTVLVHAGSKLYADAAEPQMIYDAMPDVRSAAYRLADKLVFLTGETMLVYTCSEAEGHRVQLASEAATVPQVTVGRAPNGGGETLDQVNMLTPKFVDSFLSDGSATEYQLSFFPLTADAVTAEILGTDNEWVQKTEGTDFSVNRETGVVTFNAAPAAPPVSGEDNVKIHAASVHEGYADRVNGCTFGIIYGLRGASDRLFISGNKDFPNYDFFSKLRDPLYFGDVDYGTIGKEGVPITGYSIVDGILATHKAADDNERNCYLRSGQLTDNDLTPTEFPITQVIQGAGAISAQSFAYITEPLYLTKEGIYATTPYEYNGKLYSQKRSFYLDGRLLKETDLSNAVAIAWNDFYMLCIEDRVYILDVQQKDRSGVTRGSEYQYEAYYWTNVPARVWYKDDEHLYFGAENGVIYRFFTEKMSSFSYNDNGAAIAARWDFMHKGRNFHKNKTMTRLSANLAATPNSSLSVFYRRSTDFAYTEAALDARISYFMYSALRYSGFVYGGNSEAKTISKKLKIKKYDSCVISLRNEKPDEGIVLYALTLEFNEGNPYKLDY